MSKFYIYQDSAGEWRWSLKARNNRVIADSGEGYSSRRAAIRAALRICSLGSVRIVG